MSSYDEAILAAKALSSKKHQMTLLELQDMLLEV